MENFQCAKPCEWKIKIYVDGCVRFEKCCNTDWDHIPRLYLKDTEFTPQTEVYVSHENNVPDDNGSLLDVEVLACKYLAECFSDINICTSRNYNDSKAIEINKHFISTPIIIWF